MTRAMALALAIATMVVAARFGTFAAGGSDSYCYVEQAERWAAGTITSPVAPGVSFPWRQAALSLAPTGFIPSRTHEGAIAPICPAGLSLAMAAPRVIGLPRISVFYVVPVCAGLAAWSVFLIARRIASAWNAILAVAVAVTTPVFVFQGLQPMSDVPAAALWALSLALARRGRGAAAASGLAAGAAVLVRPNLAPLAGIIGLYVWMAGHAADGEGASSMRRGTLDAVAFGLGVVPGVLGVMAVNAHLYGSPLASGYGSLDTLFAWSHVRDNLSRYPAWMLTIASALPCLALAAPWLARDRTYAWLLLAFAAGAGALYLPYVPFDNWTYLRFLLPGLLPVFALAVASIGGLAGRVRARGAAARVVPALVIAAWCGWHVARTQALDVFGVAGSERRFVATGTYAGEHLAPDALVFTIWQSGSVRYYGSRLSILWDALEPGELDPAIDALSARSRDTVLILDAFERDMFRARFAGASVFAALDWPPAARIGTSVAVWRFADRARYLRGDRIDTLLVR